MRLLYSIKNQSPWLYNGLLLISVALTGGLVWNMMTASHQKTPDLKNNYDAFAVDITSTQFSDRGTKRYELSAPRLNHYKYNNQTHVDKPVLYLYNSNQENWLVTAEYATAFQGKSKIEFVNNVDISGAGTVNHKNTQLLTEKLNYYPDKNTANTTLPVTIVQPGSTIHAIGMEVAFNAGTIALLSQIHGNYNPNVYA